MASNELQKVQTDSFECRECGYIHATEDGRKPGECISCGGRRFRKVSDEKTNSTSSHTSAFMEHISQASGKTLLLYLILVLIFLGSLFGIIILVAI